MCLNESPSVFMWTVCIRHPWRPEEGRSPGTGVTNWVLEIKPGFLSRTLSVLHGQAISPVCGCSSWEPRSSFPSSPHLHVLVFGDFSRWPCSFNYFSSKVKKVLSLFTSWCMRNGKNEVRPVSAVLKVSWKEFKLYQQSLDLLIYFKLYYQGLLMKTHTPKITEFLMYLEIWNSIKESMNVRYEFIFKF